MKAIKSLPKRTQRSVRSKLNKTRKSISTNWKSYQRQKYNIKRKFKTKVSQDKHIKELLLSTKEKISLKWSGYRDVKYTIVYKEKLEDFGLKLFKTRIEKHTRSEWFQSDKYLKDINSELLLISQKKKLKYILVEFFYKNKETGQTRVMSDSFTPEGFERVKDEDLHELFLEKLAFSTKDKSYDINDYVFMYYTIRLVFHK